MEMEDWKRLVSDLLFTWTCARIYSLPSFISLPLQHPSVLFLPASHWNCPLSAQCKASGGATRTVSPRMRLPT